MSWRTMLKLSPLALLLVIPLGWTGSPATPAGAPWISLEVPANPMDPETRDAAFLVHAYYHDRPVHFEVTGTAEGLVDGRRESLPLEVRRTSRAGVYAVSANWPEDGHWVLSLGVEARSPLSLVIELGPDGGIGEEPFYGIRSKTLASSSIRVVEGAVTPDRIDAALQALAMRSD